MILEEIGSLAIRVALGLLFIVGAWESGKDKAGRDFTTSETALVFKWRPDIFAMLGILMMGAGGLSVLLGIFPRLGALAMTVFLVPAAMIHFAKQSQAMDYARQIQPVLSGKTGDTARGPLQALLSSAMIGHFTACLKTLCLLGPSIYLVLAGGREPMLIGLGPDGQWQGLLTRL